MRKISLWSMTFCILFPGFISGIGNELIAKTYYVAPSGNNGNPGKIGSPFLTIQYGVDLLRTGDTLVVRGGTYHEKVNATYDGTSADPIVITSFPGESPVIDGQGNLPAGSWDGLVEIHGNYVYFNGFEVKNSNTNGSWDGGAGILLLGHHDKVSNCNVHNSWENGVLIQGDYGIAEYNTVHDNCLANVNDQASVHSSGLTAARDKQDGITTGAIIRGNTVFGNWGEGLSTYETNGTLIEDNIVYDNDAYDLYISDAPNTICQRNLIYSVPGQLNAWGGLVIGDELSDKPRTTNIRIINNCLYRSSFWAFNSTNVPGAGLNQAYIENNTLIDSRFKVGANANDGVVNTSAYIRNNIFSNSLADPWGQAGPLTNITMNHNVWSKLPPTEFRGTGDLTGDAGVSKTGGTGAGELTGNYFNLISTSIAINKGLVTGQATLDYFKNTRDSNPDIGAVEYLTSVQTTIKVTQIIVASVNGTTTISTDKGTLQLNATISPSNATDKNITWSIQNGTGQASISASGLVTAISNGTVTARATSNDGSGVFGTLVITITDQAVTSVSGPSAWYTFENSGNDVSGNGYNGALANGATYSSSHKEGVVSLKLDGYNDYVNIGTINLGTKFTFSSWIYMPSRYSRTLTIVANAASGAKTDGFRIFVNTGNRKIILETGNGSQSAQAQTPSSTFVLNGWNHVAVVVDQTTGQARIYLNGSDVTSVSSILNNFSVNRTIWLGRMTNGVYPMPGNLDDTRFYNRLLSPSEIASLANQVLGAPIKSTQEISTAKSFEITASPNPFRDKLTIEYNLQEDTHVNLAVYDLGGKVVKQLVNENQAEGSHTIIWNTLNSSGINLHNGIYLLKIESTIGTEISKIIHVE